MLPNGPMDLFYTGLDVFLSSSLIFWFVSCGDSSYADAYTNIERSYFGNNFEFEVLRIPIWHRIQTTYHRKEYITCGTLLVLYSACIAQICSVCYPKIN
jgi:hypothetical protein